MSTLRNILESLVGNTAAAAMEDALRALFPSEWDEGDVGAVTFHCIHCGHEVKGAPDESLHVCPYCYRSNWLGVCSQCGDVVVQTSPGVYHCPSCGAKVRIRLQKPPMQMTRSSEIVTDEEPWEKVLDAMIMLRALYTLIGQMVSIDGWIKEDEMAQLDRLFSELGIALDAMPNEYADRVRLFHEGANAPEDYREVARVVQERITSRPSFAEFVHLALEILTRIAFSDGVLSPDEARFLWELKDIWGLTDEEFEEDLFTALHALGLDEDYRTVGAHPLASWREISSACNEALRESDPDLLARQGASIEMINEARSRRAAIVDACERLRRVHEED